MYPIPDGGVLQCTFEGFVLEQQMLSVFHYQLDFPGGLTDGLLAMDAVAIQVKLAAGLHVKYMLCMSQLYIGSNIRLQWILPDRRAYKSYTGTSPDGQAPTDIFSPNVAVALNKRSDLAGPHGHGVTHMPAVPIDFVTGGKVNAAGLLAYLDFGAEAKADLVTAGSGTYHPIIYNRTTPGDIVFITNTAVDDRLRTMHRRTVRLGS